MTNEFIHIVHHAVDVVDAVDVDDAVDLPRQVKTHDQHLVEVTNHNCVVRGAFRASWPMIPIIVKIGSIVFV